MFLALTNGTPYKLWHTLQIIAVCLLRLQFLYFSWKYIDFFALKCIVAGMYRMRRGELWVILYHVVSSMTVSSKLLIAPFDARRVFTFVLPFNDIQARRIFIFINFMPLSRLHMHFYMLILLRRYTCLIGDMRSVILNNFSY